MSRISSYYTKYRQHINDYNHWNNDNISAEKNTSASFSQNNTSLQKKAKTIAEPLLLLDSYEHEKAEDSETFFQTLNIELMSIAGVIASAPIALTKALPFLNKYSDKNAAIKTCSDLINKYTNKMLQIGKRQIPLPKALTAVSAIISAVFFASGIKNSMESQLGIIRKASFDASQNIINNPQLFAVLTPQQESQVNSIVNYEEKNKSAFVDKLKEKVNINSSFQAVRDYKTSLKQYKQEKDDYLKQANSAGNAALSDKQTEDVLQNQTLFTNYLKNVEHDVLEPLRKVETISNISYSALFTGGFLEYLITDKLVDVLGIQNKPIRGLVKFGVPLLTYMLLNKNISNIENKAILATKYKHLNQFIQNPEQYSQPKDNKKESLPSFLKTVYKDMQDYNKFAENELPKLKEKMEAKKQIKLSPEQLKEAKLLQKNTAMTINNQREELYNQSVGIKALSETILGPLDILATAAGAKIGNNMAKRCPNKKLSGLFTGLGAVIAFIPAAIIEAKLTKQQKLSEKIAVMNAIKGMKNPAKFADFSPSSSKQFIDNYPIEQSQTFKDFIK